MRSRLFVTLRICGSTARGRITKFPFRIVSVDLVALLHQLGLVNLACLAPPVGVVNLNSPVGVVGVVPPVGVVDWPHQLV